MLLVSLWWQTFDADILLLTAFTEDVNDIISSLFPVISSYIALVVMPTHHIKFNPPRALTSEETQQTMQQWKINFRQYIKRDDTYRTFLNMDWNPAVDDYGLAAETTGLQRTAAALKNDLLDFLHILASYMPHGYLTDKLISKSKSLASAFELIEENFNLLPTQESFFEFLSIKKMSLETYRQMFDRMVAFATQHLMPSHQGDLTVDGVAVPALC